MKKFYKVAGHSFAVDMPSACPLWGMMGQYLPFEDVPCDTTVFSLSLVDSLPECEMEPVYTETPSAPDQSRIELFKIPGGWRLYMAPAAKARRSCTLDTDESFTAGRLLLEPERRTALYSLNNALMILFAFRTASLKTLEMHASVVVRGGKGYLFLGKSGTGKSTHSRQWLESFPDAFLLNDDNPVVRIADDGAAVVYGSPWSGKTPCYKNDSAPIGAIVRIRQCPDNKIARMSAVEAYASVYSSCSGLKFHKAMAEGLHEAMGAVAVGVPCYLLDCRPDHEAARVCYEAVK